MQNLALVALTLNEHTVSLSNGVPILNRKGQMDGAGIRIRTISFDPN